MPGLSLRFLMCVLGPLVSGELKGSLTNLGSEWKKGMKMHNFCSQVTPWFTVMGGCIIWTSPFCFTQKGCVFVDIVYRRLCCCRLTNDHPNWGLGYLMQLIFFSWYIWVQNLFHLISSQMETLLEYHHILAVNRFQKWKYIFSDLFVFLMFISVRRDVECGITLSSPTLGKLFSNLVTINHPLTSCADARESGPYLKHIGESPVCYPLNQWDN